MGKGSEMSLPIPVMSDLADATGQCLGEGDVGESLMVRLIFQGSILLHVSLYLDSKKIRTQANNQKTAVWRKKFY